MINVVTKSVHIQVVILVFTLMFQEKYKVNTVLDIKRLICLVNVVNRRCEKAGYMTIPSFRKKSFL